MGNDIENRILDILKKAGFIILCCEKHDGKNPFVLAGGKKYHTSNVYYIFQTPNKEKYKTGQKLPKPLCDVLDILESETERPSFIYDRYNNNIRISWDWKAENKNENTGKAEV